MCFQGEHNHGAPPMLHQQAVRSSHARRSTGLVGLRHSMLPGQRTASCF